MSLLAEGPATVLELLEHFSFSQPALSRHLRVLREAGVVAFTKQGRTHLYTLNGEAIRDAGDWLLAQHAFWNERLDDLGATLDAIAAEEEAS